MARFSVSIWCAYDTHIPHTPKPNHCFSYAHQSQFLHINSTPNRNRKSPLKRTFMRSGHSLSRLLEQISKYTKYYVTMAVLTSIQVNAVGYVLNKHKQLRKYWMCVSIMDPCISYIRLIMLIKQQKKNMRITH